MSTGSEQSGTDNAALTLTQCTACGKSIGVMADKCIGCGAPNSWEHPDVVNLVEAMKASQVLPAWGVEWRYGHDKERVWGSSSTTLTGAGWIVRFVQWLGWFGVVWMHMTEPVKLWTWDNALRTGTPTEDFMVMFQVFTFVSYGIAIWIAKRMIGTQVMLSVPESTFEARFHPNRQWTSSNESLWAHIRSKAGFSSAQRKQEQANPIDELALFFNSLPKSTWNKIIIGLLVAFFFLTT